MLVSLPILVALRCIIYHWKWIDEHFRCHTFNFRYTCIHHMYIMRNPCPLTSLLTLRTLSNASLIMWIHSAVHKILADKAFTATDGLISQLFVVAFVHPAYVRIALIWGFPVQLSLWKSIHWLWRYKLNKVCDSIHILYRSYLCIDNNFLVEFSNIFIYLMVDQAFLV